MKYKLELTINKPRAEVWQTFDSTENTKKWQPTLKEVELIDGTPGQPGAISKLTYEESEREFALNEKITFREEQTRFDSVYENDFTENSINNSFIEQDDNKTLWVLETKYTFKTMAMRVIGPLGKKNFVARTQKDMERFKELVESL